MRKSIEKALKKKMVGEPSGEEVTVDSVAKKRRGMKERSLGIAAHLKKKMGY